MNLLNDNVIVRCSVRNFNLIFEIINKIEVLVFCFGEYFKWKNVNFIGVIIILKD